MRNKAQVAIFIIIAIVLLAGIALLFALRTTKPTVNGGDEFEAEHYLDSCVRMSVRDHIEPLLLQGGSLEPRDYVTINNTRIQYLCKNVNYYGSCINQYPLLASHMEQELRRAVDSDVRTCFNALKEELARRNYGVSGSMNAIDVDIKPDVVTITLNGNLTLTKNEATRVITHLDTAVRSPIYNMALLAQEIVSQEEQYCYFEYIGYMILYPSWDVRVSTREDSTKLYSVSYLPTGDRMNFAIRGCAIPAGF